MLHFIGRRLLAMVPFLFLTSVTVFTLIQLPPGDYLSNYAAQLAESSETVDQATLENLRQRYGLGQPLPVQYLKWIGGVLQGDFGQSFEWQQPVWPLIRERLGLTLLVTLSALIFTWAVALPIGIYSAVRKYSLADYLFTFIGFVGLAVPGFLLALVVMYVAVTWFGQSVGGLFSEQYEGAPWSLGKVLDLLAHLWIPMVVIGLSGTASLIRIMRANLLDELNKPYVETARAKGLPEWKLLLRYPVRAALNPFVSTLGWILPHLVSGSVIVAVVLNLPIAGPLLLQSLLSQDMYLAGAFLLLLCCLTVLGTLLSDILLALLDPRIRFE
ncbi:ABC transporter permease [Roseomonas sp. M0104]|uniref:ABC transporter permease n=1 Tax=Teichococcus coralli TaxID=2545983 RepID=A0A845B7W1_9PROT|nr:ABC transporter permease [Pseudoroseomonas coralli]MXP62795.1 ABC transporter permease [Pseudoroseomonas coralli]